MVAGCDHQWQARTAPYGWSCGQWMGALKKMEQFAELWVQNVSKASEFRISS